MPTGTPLRYLDSAIAALWRGLSPPVLRALMTISIIGSFAYFQSTFPITVGDTDMWYHLADGRQILETGSVPRTFYYSFADWPYEPGLHSWLFQLSIYVAHDLGGYWALLAIRAALSIVSAILVVALVYFSPRTPLDSRATSLALGILALVACLVLLSKTYQLRPHLASAALIALTLLIFEWRRGLWSLPIVAVLWANIHGIEWVVAGVIAAAYTVEAFADRRRDPSDPEPAKLLAWSAIAAAALLINPSGYELLLQPFDLSPDYHKFVSEMQPMPLSRLVSPSLPLLSFSPGSAPAIAGVLSVVAWLSLALGHRLRLSHAIMSLSGLLLLLQGSRFLTEWVLLCLPMLRSFVVATAAYTRACAPSAAWLKVAIAAWILAAPALAFPATRLKAPKLPFNADGLPTGTGEFLAATGAKGRLFAPPNLAGYFAWTLYPDVTIFSDMKHPDMPTFYNVSTWRNPHALSRTQDRHRPDFFAVPLADRVTPKRIAERGRFSAVFTDDLFVLYADLERHPVLGPFAFKSLEPHTLAPTAGKEQEATAEMQRVALQHPAGRRVREKLWKQAMDGKDYVAAERHADELLRAHPGDLVGLFMKASVLEQTERCAAAMAIFAEIHPDLAPESQRKVRRHQGSCSYLDRDFRSAYAAFREGINPYRDGVEPEYLYQYAFVAAIEGGPAEALRALDMLAFLVDPADQSLVEKAAALRATVESDEFR